MNRNNKLIVLLDTNVMMVALSPRSNLHSLFQSFINGEYTLVISNEILLEYEEQIRRRYDESIIAEFMLIMGEAPNILHNEPFFKWNLITAGPDDNKFSDAAVSSAADYIVTHDKHFDILKEKTFPVINVINAYAFQKLLLEKRNKK